MKYKKKNIILLVMFLIIGFLVIMSTRETEELTLSQVFRVTNVEF
ncbi:Polysaccharide intercellular adhesin (PIA) biosynthesis deacetylase IcaB [Lactococcus cremoris]|jgi:hypothetical protein|nr:hypothetical protein LLNZ_03345 [Lactococcus cremoris subsp. cremoris NZ9000]KZK52765.1 Polysaccharide intercellular adhesin (PIA) biosynthesis deacetylase IcaB [Lactococcus cremoris]